ncbi:hypothetical protein EGW08_003665 [Elysia chlorotica]|uniref:Antistasin-like domain-containing protein n=1 Tax=Elysia chlorotica TaxID=188477 RepID=A0A433U425_ELYCH|nr:hypothetical protein EGW08_003665 [Elysia chlorotica]
MTELTCLVGVVWSVLFSALIAATDAQFSSMLCILKMRSKCAVGEMWDPKSCACVSERTKCQYPRCPVRSYSARCIVYRKDSNGCPTCDCECDELSQICPVNCPNGIEILTRHSGCKECMCRPNICNPIVCENVCPFGRAVDIKGCQTCRCKPKRLLCPPVMCGEMCPYGTFEDTNNCPTCVCKPKPICPILSCDTFCPNGRLLDSNGCDRCACKPVQRRSCPLRACPALCLNGHQLDEHGCPTCKCKPNFLWQQITWRQ